MHRPLEQIPRLNLHLVSASIGILNRYLSARLEPVFSIIASGLGLHPGRFDYLDCMGSHRQQNWYIEAKYKTTLPKNLLHLSLEISTSSRSKFCNISLVVVCALQKSWNFEESLRLEKLLIRMSCCLFIVISEANTWLRGKAPHCIYVPAPTLFRQSYHIEHHKAYALLEVVTPP